jgi:hypothetical protein
MIFGKSGAGIGTTKLENKITRTNDDNISKNELKPTALLNFCDSQLGNQSVTLRYSLMKNSYICNLSKYLSRNSQNFKPICVF